MLSLDAVLLMLFSSLFVFFLACVLGVSSGKPGPMLLVANKSDRTLSIIEVESGRQMAAVPFDGNTGHEVAVSRDGLKAFVPIYGDAGVGLPGTDGDQVAVIDLVKRKLTGVIRFDHGIRPHCAVVGPRDGLLYLTAEVDNAVAVTDPDACRVLGFIPTGQEQSHMLAITRDGKRGYTANVAPGTVSVLDLDNRNLMAVIPVARKIQRISLSVDDRYVFTADQTEPRLAVIDTATNLVKAWIPLPGIGFATAPTLDGDWLLVAMTGLSAVAVVDLKQMKVLRTIEVPKLPQEFVIRPDNKAAYVSCDLSRKVAVIGIPGWGIVGLLDAGAEADGLAYAEPK
jgi:DNA-binding beta-propeller fold protein YncE